MAVASTWKWGLNANAPAGANLVYARSITAATVAARQPVGFSTGGSCAWVYNSSTTLFLLVTFYNFALLGTDPTLTFPVDGGPPTGQPGILIPPNAARFVDNVGAADSFAAIASAAGPTLIYVQRGEGTGP